MSSHAANRRNRYVVVMAAALAIASCGATKNSNVVVDATTVAMEPVPHTASVSPPQPAVKAGDAADFAPEPIGAGVAAEAEVSGADKEAPGERVFGRWQVIDAAGPASANAMVGRTLSFNEQTLGWVGANGKPASECPDPLYHVIVASGEVRSFAPAFKDGWAKFRIPRKDIGPMHTWECGDGETTFGPPKPADGSVFYPVGSDRLVMNWFDGAVLLLRRQS